MGRTLLLVGIGGAAGSMARYLVSHYFQKTNTSAFPYGTLAVNLIGCLLIGIVWGLSLRYRWFTEEWRIFFAVGVCGGFTTFSAFSADNLRLLEEGHQLTALAYILLSVILGLVLVFAGMALTKL